MIVKFLCRVIPKTWEMTWLLFNDSTIHIEIYLVCKKEQRNTQLMDIPVLIYRLKFTTYLKSLLLPRSSNVGTLLSWFKVAVAPR